MDLPFATLTAFISTSLLHTLHSRHKKNENDARDKHQQQQQQRRRTDESPTSERGQDRLSDSLSGVDYTNKKHALGSDSERNTGDSLGVLRSDPLACANAMTKDQVKELRSQYFCKSVSVSYANSGPLMIVGGRGTRLIDSTGTSYLDTRNNVCHCGHQNPHVIKAISQQVATLNTNTRYLHSNIALLAQRLTNLLPEPLEKVFFVNSGSEANDLALRLARSYTKSKNTIVVEGAYHGHTLKTMEVSPYKYCRADMGAGEFDLVSNCTYSTTFMKSQEKDVIDETYMSKYLQRLDQTPGRHVWCVPCPDTYRGLHRNAKTAAAKYASYVEEACRVYCNDRKEKVGAFIIEGGMSVAGVILPPPSYLKRCADAVRASGGIYIADEVQTGFGRLGSSYWAFQHHPSDGEEDEERHDTTVIPDIVTVGKPFGNGMPLAAVVTTREISDAFESIGVEYFNTFGGNPVCAAAGLAVLDVIELEGLQENAAWVGGYLKSRLIELQTRLDIVGDVRGSGLFLGVELVRNRQTLEPATEETSFLCTVMKEKYKILTSIDGLNDNVLVIKPPMVFSTTDADQFVTSFESAVMTDLKGVDVTNISRTPT